MSPASRASRAAARSAAIASRSAALRHLVPQHVDDKTLMQEGRQAP